MTLPFPYSAHYWFDSGYASLFLHVEQISRDADRGDVRVPRQKPAADSRTDLRHPSAAGLKFSWRSSLSSPRTAFNIAFWSRSRADR